MEEVRLRPWAKINLYLEVLGKGDNGYHQIRTLIQPIALFDELTLRRVPPFRFRAGRLPQGIRFNCKVEDDLPGKENLSVPSKNLITKAVLLFFDKIGKAPSVEVNLTKHIPIGGGLGGGSSDAASALIGLNQLWGYPLEDRELGKLAASLGMDIPCFLDSPKPMICSGRGEVIEERWDGDKKEKFWCVLVNPRKGLSTASVYREFSLSLTQSSSKDIILRLFSNIYNNISSIVNYIRNDLEDTAAKLYPELSRIIGVLNSAGVLKSFVCGSGSTVCGLTANKVEADGVAGKIREIEGSRDWWVRVVSAL